MLDIDFDVDVKNALASFEVLQNWRKRKSIIRQAKYAAAKIIRKRAHSEFDSHGIKGDGDLKKTLARAKTAIWRSKNFAVRVQGGGLDVTENKEDPAWYAKYVEMGTKNTPAKRFLMGTAERHADEAKQAFIDKWDDLVEKDLQKTRR